MNLWPVEHFFEHICHHFWVAFWNDLLQNPYFSFIHGANAIYGISQICVESGQERGTEHDQKSDFVMESKNIVVDLDWI